MTPMLLLLFILSLVLVFVFVQTSAIAPFIYTLFLNAGIGSEGAARRLCDRYTSNSNNIHPEFFRRGFIERAGACEYVHDMNWQRGTSSLRTMVLTSGSVWPTWGS